MDSLEQLYRKNEQKTTDRWLHYLECYQSRFEVYLNRPLRLLEIGIQNGGSLDVWAHFFPNATHLIGCDINPLCKNLLYKDPRISVILGDANQEEVSKRIANISPTFDLIIDDGSHVSSDIIRSFIKYFEILEHGGLYVIEDLHCSYWKSYEGGLYEPTSAMAFLKRLVDIVNYEHWRCDISINSCLEVFIQKYGITIKQELLSTIHSIEFSNSLCFIRKEVHSKNILGERLITGTESVTVRLDDIKKDKGSSKDITGNIEIDDGLTISVEEAYLNSISESKRLLNEARRLRMGIELHEADLDKARLEIASLRNSTSWKLTSPLRKLKNAFKKLKDYKTRIVMRWRSQGLFLGTMYIIKMALFKVLQSFFFAGYGHKKINDIDYHAWILESENCDEDDLKRHLGSLAIKPLISVIMPTYNSNIVWLKEAIESVRAQIYSNWELCIADDNSSTPEVLKLLSEYTKLDPRIKVTYRGENGHISAASNTALESAKGEFVGLLDHDDVLSKHALYWLIEAINKNPEASMFYSDEDKMDFEGRRLSPYFKSDWNLDLFYSHNMFSHLGVYRKSVLDKIGGFRVGYEGSQDYDLALRAFEVVGSEGIVHIPKILYHWRIHNQSTAGGAEAKPYAMIAGERAINDHFARTGVQGSVKFTGYGYQPKYIIPSPAPLVSIIIPTRNGFSLLKNCLESIFKKTNYSNYEIIIVDNRSDDPNLLAYLDELESNLLIKKIIYDNEFNYSAINNFAINFSNGSIIALLNNDVEVISENWLSEMVSHAIRPGIGAVGAKLIYPNNTIQHAGVILGVGGIANHAHRHFPKNHPGYFSRASLVNCFSAVTGACLVVSKDLYASVGGLNEDELAISFNDIDFCLKLNKSGLRNLFTPYAILYHHESATRGYDNDPIKISRLIKEEEYMKSTWGCIIHNDPMYSPNLSKSKEDFSLFFK
jgi:GT2 family glycosyltransferase